MFCPPSTLGLLTHDFIMVVGTSKLQPNCMNNHPNNIIIRCPTTQDKNEYLKHFLFLAWNKIWITKFVYSLPIGCLMILPLTSHCTFLLGSLWFVLMDCMARVVWIEEVRVVWIEGATMGCNSKHQKWWSVREENDYTAGPTIRCSNGDIVAWGDDIVLW